MLPIDVGQQPPTLRQIKIEPELINTKNNFKTLPISSSPPNLYFLEPLFTPTPIIDTSTPESLERDFHAWMKGELKGRKSFTSLEPVSMYLNPLKGEFVNTTTQTLLPLSDRYSPPHYYTTLQPLLPLSNENERRFSLPSLNFKTKSDICFAGQNPSAGQSPSSSTHSSSSEGSPQIQRLNECEQLMPSSGLSSNSSGPSLDAINGVQIDSSASRSSGVNQLGRTYSPGLPLSMSERQQIVDLHKSGWKICDISKCLCVTHSCVSKILQRYRTTGSVRPKDAKEGRQESPLVAAIRDYRTRLGIVRQSEIREQLIRDGLCRRENAPSRSSINHILRTKLNNVVDSHRQNNKNK